MKIIWTILFCAVLFSCKTEQQRDLTSKKETIDPISDTITKADENNSTSNTEKVDDSNQQVEKKSNENNRNTKVEKDFPIPAMSIRTDITQHTVFIEGGLESQNKDAFLRDLAQDAINCYKFAKDAYPVSVADDFENGIATYHSSQPKTMIIHYQISVYKGSKKVDEINQRWIAGIRNESYLSELQK